MIDTIRLDRVGKIPTPSMRASWPARRSVRAAELRPIDVLRLAYSMGLLLVIVGATTARVAPSPADLGLDLRMAALAILLGGMQAMCARAAIRHALGNSTGA
jgi:hypothetical protein